MERLSQYFRNLSATPKERYEQKVISIGLKHDPYVIEDWSENSADVHWSDLLVYMIATPSQFMGEVIKVNNCFTSLIFLHAI